MTPETMMFVAGGAVGLAFLLFVVKKLRGPAQEQLPAGSAYLAPMAASPKNPIQKNQRNKRGWRAPAGHYFNDADELYTDAGDLIVDMLIIAELCREPHDIVATPEAVEALKSGVEEAGPGVVEIEEAVGSETIASRPNELESVASEVNAGSSFSDLRTADDTSYTSTASYGGGCDSGDSGGDSGGGDCGGGGSDD